MMKINPIYVSILLLIILASPGISHTLNIAFNEDFSSFYGILAMTSFYTKVANPAASPTIPDFSISVTPSSQTILRESMANFTVTLTTPAGYGYGITAIRLTVSDLPVGVAGFFTPSTVELAGGGTSYSKLTVIADSIAQSGSYPIVVSGESPISFHSMTIELIISESSWTFMVYMDGDNNLEDWWIREFNQMEEVGSSSEVNIVVLFDRYSTNEAILYHVSKESPSTNNIVSSEIENWGPINTGDPDILRRFISWTATNYKASHYALVLQNHGGGFTGVIWDDHSGYDHLTMEELKTALNDAGTYFEVIIFYACMMQMTEVAYQIKSFSHYMVGSEEIAYTGDINYNQLLSDLVSNPDMSGRQLAINTVRMWRKYPACTISAIDLWQMDSLAISLNDFARSLILSLPDHQSQIQNNRKSTDNYYYPYFIDLFHFAELVEEDPTFAYTILGTSSKSVMENVEKAVISDWRGEAHFDSHGSSIYFPESGYIDYYDDLVICQLIQWDDFIKAYESS